MSSFLGNVPRNSSYKTTEENIYTNTEDSVGGEYCGLTPGNFSTQNPAFRHPSTSAYSDQERHSSTQTARGTDAERNKRRKNVTLQDAARHNPEHPSVFSTNRVIRARLASDSEIRNNSVSSRRPAEWSRTRTTDTHTGSTTVPESTVRVQPSNTSHGNRRISEGLPSSDQNNVIINQPKPRAMFPREPRHGGQDTHRVLSDTRENSSRNPLPKPRTIFPNESKRGTENRQDLMPNKISLDKEELKKPIPRGGNGRPRETQTDKLDLDMNRTRGEKWQRNDKVESGHHRVGRQMIPKQSSREEWSLNHGVPREQRIEETRENRPHLSSDTSSLRFQRQLGNMERGKKFVATTDDARVGCNKAPQTLSTAYRDGELEMTGMVPPCNPRILQLRREERPVKYPLLGLAFPRPHSFDVPENKTKFLRTLSSPELRGSSNEELLNTTNDKEKCAGNGEHQQQQQHNNNQCFNQPNTQTSNHSSKGIVKMKGKRSKSLPVAANTRGSSALGRRGPSADPSPLRYFAYLGKRFQFRERLLSAHNVSSARPVILTSTSVISPEVTTNFCQQLEEQDSDPCGDLGKHQGACQDLIDCCTCMCCVKALFYHCTKDDESEGHYAEHPCSCNGPGTNCFCRWSVLGMLSMIMPCILCYLPIQGCKRGVEYFRRKSNTPDSEQ